MIEYAAVSEIGEKEKNEDAVRVFVNRMAMTYGFVLADGLGGHGNGDIASNFVCDCVGAAMSNSDQFGAEYMAQCFDTAQRLLMQEKEAKGLVSIKTTMVMLSITGHLATWGHIGDSRLYHFRNGKQLSCTPDHSLPQLLLLQKKIKEKDIRHHPDRSRLLRAMGSEWDEPEYEIDMPKMRVQKGDDFLLCSDGFWEWIDEKTMIKLLKREFSTYGALNAMTQVVKENGKGKGMDNFSAILVRVR